MNGALIRHLKINIFSYLTTSSSNRYFTKRKNENKEIVKCMKRKLVIKINGKSTLCFI